MTRVTMCAASEARSDAAVGLCTPRHSSTQGRAYRACARTRAARRGDRATRERRDEVRTAARDGRRGGRRACVGTGRDAAAWCERGSR